MAPGYINRHFFDDGSGYITPDELQDNFPAANIPLTFGQAILPTDQGTPIRDSGRDNNARQKVANAVASDPRLKSRTDTDTSAKLHARSEGANNKSSLRFMVVGHPDQLKDKTQMRKNRMHVMHNYLAKEAQNPESKDSRVHGSGVTNRRRKAPSKALNTTLNLNAPSAVSRPDLSRLTPPNSDQSASSSSERDSDEATAIKASRMASSSDIVSSSLASKYDQPLVRGIGGGFENSRYIKASTRDVPFSVRVALTANDLGRDLEPFDVWPAFSDPSMNLFELKWSCCQRFGSSSLSMHWIPTMLRARHAFLSTLCISSAYDDLMYRALLPANQQKGETLLTRMKVRQGVISLINESMNDPDMRSADETMIAVLHVLNSEIMGCDDRSMRVHQMGLHEMVRERGGLDKLGVAGQLASILTM